MVLPDTPAALARWEGIAIANECLTPLDSKTTQNLVDAGRGSAAAAVVCGRCSWVPLTRCGARDRGEGLRRTHGEAAGVKLGPAPVNRWAVNVGTLPVSPSPKARQVVGGQAHCQLMVPGGGRALVVVGARESRAQGEGGQQTWHAVRSQGGRR